jgi:hypothetical protein
MPIGIGAAFFGYYVILLIRGSKKVDDSLDVLACHGIGGGKCWPPEASPASGPLAFWSATPAS